MSEIRTAIVGLGAISTEHVDKLRHLPQVRVVGLCDLSATLAAAAAERFGIGPAYTDLDVMLAEARPDVVHVLTPPQTHRDLVLRILDAGAHVFVEKPIAPSWEEYVEMRDAALARDRLLVENYNYRFIDVVRRAVELTRSGDIGELVHADVSFGVGMADPSGPYADRDLVHFGHALPGGAMRNFVSHPVSIALALLGDPRAVRVAQHRLREGSPSTDELRALVSGDRATAGIAVTSHARPSRFTLAVQGTAGAIEVDVYDRRIHVDAVGAPTAKITNGLRHGLSYVAGTAGLLARSATGQHDYFEGLAHLLAGFYAAVGGDGEPPVSVADMDRTNRLVNDLFLPEHQL